LEKAGIGRVSIREIVNKDIARRILRERTPVYQFEKGGWVLDIL
jgi:hypothetical protein